MGMSSITLINTEDGRWLYSPRVFYSRDFIEQPDSSFLESLSLSLSPPNHGAGVGGWRDRGVWLPDTILTESLDGIHSRLVSTLLLPDSFDRPTSAPQVISI